MTPPGRPPPDRCALFEQTLDRLEDALARALRLVIAAVAADLERVGEAEPSQGDRQSLYAVGAMLRIEERARVGAAGRALHERSRRCLEHLERTGDEARALQLIEEDELRVQILAGEVARAVRQLAGAGYDAYSARSRTLAGGLWEDDEVDPIGARVLSSAALAAFDGLGDGGSAAAALRASVATHLAPALAQVLEDAERWLQSKGVEQWRDPTASGPVSAPAPPPPGAQASEGFPPPGTAPTPASSAPATPSPADEWASMAPQSGSPERSLDATAQAALAAAALGSSPLSGEGARRTPLSVVPTLQPVAGMERDALAFAYATGTPPYSREARSEFFGGARRRLRAAGVPPAQVAVVDLVAAMFDYVVDDQRVPEAAKPLIWRLQQPAVALALLDPAYLGDEPRSLRRLVEDVGAIVNAFADDLSHGSELYKRLDTVVRAVEIVSGALQARSAVMARQIEHEYARAARNVTQLIERIVQERSSLEAAPSRRNRRDYSRRPDRGREREVTERLSGLLAERLERHEAPESVREFLLNVWLRHLRTAILRDGEDSTEYRLALEVVDDLLWSLDEGRGRQSRSELARKIPSLIRLLTQGLRAIGARDDEFKPFFDELFLIHLRKMQRKGRRGDPATGIDTTSRAGPRSRIPRMASVTVSAPTPPLTATSPTAAQPPMATQSPTAAQPPAAQPPAAQPSEASAAAPGEPGSISGRPEPSKGAETQADASGRRLLEVLASLDLADLPLFPEEVDEGPEDAIGALRRGDWVRLGGGGEPRGYAKVAWINERRTVVLMVRDPDRRALSMRADELLDRFRNSRAARLL